MHNGRFWILGISFIVGMTLAALIAGGTMRKVKRMEEFVTVKGLSEREVPADLGIWRVSFTVSANELSGLQQLILSYRGVVSNFLKEQGFEENEISNAPPGISDSQAANHDSEPTKRATRYEAEVAVLLRTNKVAKLKSALETCDKLVQQGVVLSGDNYNSKPQFLFTGLNTIKPDMIQEANRNARKAAERFAADSGSPVGAIRHAVQGPFEVNDVDPSTPDRKIVRVVTTVDFYLQ